MTCPIMLISTCFVKQVDWERIMADLLEPAADQAARNPIRHLGESAEYRAARQALLVDNPQRLYRFAPARKFTAGAAS